MIVFEEATFAYPGSGMPAIDAVDLVVAEGERVALVGPNGSGKSTLALMMNGILVPQGGRVLVDGLDTADPRNAMRVRASVGLVLQNPDNQIVGAVVEEDVAFGPENLALPPEEIRRRVRAAIDAVGLAGLERREPHTLSEGQKQRLAIAGALAMEPRYLVLDEPTAMLDPAGRYAVLEALSDLALGGHGVVHVTHDAGEIALCGRAVGLRDGRVVYDGPALSLLEDPDMLTLVDVEPSFSSQVALALRAYGVDVPLVVDPAHVVEAVWA